MLKVNYTYKATVFKVIDGDTIDVHWHLGGGVSRLERFRLARIDAPEMRGESRAKGQESTEFLKSYLSIGRPIIIETHKDRKGSFGRYLADVWVDDGDGEPFWLNVNNLMVAKGHAVFKDY
jgi:micrococcal nuclease